MVQATVIFGLGSNLGDRQAHLEAAVRALTAIAGPLTHSRIFESRAVLPADAPATWNRPYLNMAVAGKTKLPAQALLATVKEMERTLGRSVSGVWGPREIDIDILAMDSQAIDTPELAIPHRELLGRDFALLPLCDVVPDWRYPMAGEFFQWSAADIVKHKGYAPGPHLRVTELSLHD